VTNKSAANISAPAPSSTISLSRSGFSRSALCIALLLLGSTVVLGLALTRCPPVGGRIGWGFRPINTTENCPRTTLSGQAPLKNFVRRLVWRVNRSLELSTDWPIAFRNTVQNGSLRKPLFIWTRIMVMKPAATVGNKKNREFDPKTFLATIGAGRKIVTVPKKQTIYAQGALRTSTFAPLERWGPTCYWNRQRLKASCSGTRARHRTLATKGQINRCSSISFLARSMSTCCLAANSVLIR
jgi:hypothetical protein